MLFFPWLEFICYSKVAPFHEKLRLLFSSLTHILYSFYSISILMIHDADHPTKLLSNSAQHSSTAQLRHRDSYIPYSLLLHEIPEYICSVCLLFKTRSAVHLGFVSYWQKHHNLFYSLLFSFYYYGSPCAGSAGCSVSGKAFTYAPWRPRGKWRRSPKRTCWRSSGKMLLCSLQSELLLWVSMLDVAPSSIRSL